MIEKTLWREDFRNLPDWPCPKCRNGRLYLVDGSLQTEETKASKSAHQHEAFEASWMEGRFSAHLQCSDKECGEGAVVVGAVRYEEDLDYDHEGRTVSDIVEIYYPELIHPSPCVIDLPPEVPDKVETEIRRASALVWIDTASSANKLRLAAERLLTAKGVKRFTINAKRKKSYVKLHDRIGMLPRNTRILQTCCIRSASSAITAVTKVWSMLRHPTFWMLSRSLSTLLIWHSVGEPRAFLKPQKASRNARDTPRNRLHVL